jgi:hypothetical protein
VHGQSAALRDPQRADAADGPSLTLLNVDGGRSPIQHLFAQQSAHRLGFFEVLFFLLHDLAWRSRHGLPQPVHLYVPSVARIDHLIGLREAVRLCARDGEVLMVGRAGQQLDGAEHLLARGILSARADGRECGKRGQAQSQGAGGRPNCVAHCKCASNSL